MNDRSLNINYKIHKLLQTFGQLPIYQPVSLKMQALVKLMNVRLEIISKLPSDLITLTTEVFICIHCRGYRVKGQFCTKSVNRLTPCSSESQLATQYQDLMKLLKF